MTSPEVRAQIRRYFYAGHWKIGTILFVTGFVTLYSTSLY